MQNFLDNQINAFDKLCKVKCGALFMEAGTGKTRSAMKLIKSTDTDYVLWFTPFQTKSNLQKEINKWGGLDCDIVGIESVQNSDRIYLDLLSKLEKMKKSTIVVDESLKIKNADAKRTNRLFELSKFSQYRLILNGTPLSKNLLDLWAQIHFLSPKILNMDLSEFQNTYCEYIKVVYHSQSYGRYVSKEFIKKYHNIDCLYKIIEPFVFESKLSLSIGQQHINFNYNLSDEEKTEHDKIKEKYLDDKMLLVRNNNIFLEITQKMQHNYSLSQEKFNIVDDLLKTIDKTKVLIYAKYIDTQNKLKEHYKDIKVLSLQKHSYGLNLQEYNTIIFWDKTWDYAQREQIERRVFRTGQEENCIYYDLTANIGLDNMINKNIETKKTLLDLFNEKTIEELKKEL